MVPLTIARLRERAGKQAVVDWMKHAALRIDDLKGFTRVCVPSR